MAFDDFLKSVSGAVSSAQNVVNTVSNVANTVNSIATNPRSAIINAIKTGSFTAGSADSVGTAGGAASAASVSFGGPGNADDWRVRLSLPTEFQGSAVLKPLKDANGLVFPYTPTMTIAGTAQYEDVGITHQNYQFSAYQNSKQEHITIDGPFNVQDYVQAQYWIAVVHFLRSATKMYTGDSPNAGSPPPIVYLNGYGDYVFKNVPVVITAFNVSLPQDVDYIATDMNAPAFSGATGSATAAETASGMSPGARATSTAGAFPAVSGVTHVPVKSTISVTLKPIYSREAVRQFSLSKFVNGDYVNGTGGYI